MLWEAPHIAEGLDTAPPCWHALLGRGAGACLSQPAGGGMGRLQSCRLHRLQGRLWGSGEGFWVRFSFPSCPVN